MANDKQPFTIDRKKKALPNVFKDEDQEQEEKEEQAKEEKEDIIEEVPEAFIPQFNIAPDDIPVTSQVHIPTDEEKQKTSENVLGRLGVKAREFASKPVEELTPEQTKTLGRVSLMAARIFSSVSMWAFSIFGFEYGSLAPTPEQSYRMIHPLAKIVTRHADFVGNISPDVDDIIDCLTAVSDYAIEAMAIMSEIREDKLRNNGRYTGRYNPPTTNTGENRASFSTSGLDNIRENTTVANQRIENNGGTEPVNVGNLTESERQHHAMLQQLSLRDFQARARRSGRV